MITSCNLTYANTLKSYQFHKKLMGTPASPAKDCDERMCEAKRRMCYTICQYEELRHKDRVVMTNDLLGRALSNCNAYVVFSKLVEVAKGIKEQRAAAPTGTKGALETMIGERSHEFGELLWPYLDSTCSYPLMQACKTLRAFGLEHNRQNTLSVFGIDPSGNRVDGFPCHAKKDDENIVRPGTNIRFKLQVSSTILQRVVTPATAGTNETEDIKSKEIVHDRCGRAVKRISKPWPISSNESECSGVDIALVEDDEERTWIGDAVYVNSSESHLVGRVASDAMLVRKDDPFAAFKNGTMPVHRLDVKALSGKQRRRFRLRFSLMVHAKHASTSSRIAHPWVVYSDPFLSVSRLNSEEARANKRERDQTRCAKLREDTATRKAQRVSNAAAAAAVAAAGAAPEA